MRGFVPLTALALVAALFAAPGAGAVVPCQGASRPHTLVEEQGSMESVISGADGRLYYTATPEEGGRLMVLPRVGGKPRVVNEPIKSPGGLALDDRGRILVGFGSFAVNGVTGMLVPVSGLWRVNPRTGERKLFTDGLSMANGIARESDGTVYASDDFGINIDRVRNGHVEQGWIRTLSPNGLAISRDERYLYWAQTLVPPQISRTELAHPNRIDVFAKGVLPEDLTAALDGLIRDARDRLFVVTNVGGEVWRVDTQGRACKVAGGLDRPSALAFGSGRRGFARENLYVVEFGGRLSEIASARAARYPAG